MRRKQWLGEIGRGCIGGQFSVASARNAHLTNRRTILTVVHDVTTKYVMQETMRMTRLQGCFFGRLCCVTLSCAVRPSSWWRDSWVEATTVTRSASQSRRRRHGLRYSCKSNVSPYQRAVTFNSAERRWRDMMWLPCLSRADLGLHLAEELQWWSMWSAATILKREE